MSRLLVFLLFVGAVYSYDVLNGPGVEMVEMVCSEKRCLFGDVIVEAPNNTITRFGSLTINRVTNAITTDSSFSKVIVSVCAAMLVIMGVIVVDHFPE